MHAVTKYNPWGQPQTTTDTSGSTTRTTNITYDNADRLTYSLAAGNDGAVATVAQMTQYDPNTGLVTCISTRDSCTGSTVTTAYDSLGRVDSQTDTEGDTTTTDYDIDSRPTIVTESKSAAAYSATTSYLYDGATTVGGAPSADAAGNPEHRGQLTGIDNGLPNLAGVFTGAYDQDGNLTKEVYPNDHNSVGAMINSYGGDGAVANWTYDTIDHNTAKSYCFSSCDGFWAYSNTIDEFDRVASSSDNIISTTYEYDPAGRLTDASQIDNNISGTFSRHYTYDQDSNRLSVTPGSTSYDGYVTAAAPSADWHLDETSGNTAADSVGSTPGNYTAAGNTLGVTGATPGTINLGIAFSGNAPLTTANTSAITLNSHWTIQFWIKAAAPSTSYTIMRKGGGVNTGDGWTITALPTGAVQFTRDGRSVQVTGALTGKWQEVTFTYNGSTLNGTAATFANDTSSTGLTIGGGGQSFSLDELAIYPTALTASQGWSQSEARIYDTFDQTGHTYDDADRLTDTGTIYDTLGRTTTIPVSDATIAGIPDTTPPGNATASYYENDQVASLTQAGVTTSYTLDPLYRLDTTTVSAAAGSRTLQHYSNGAANGIEAASWIETQNSSGTTTDWSRNLQGLDGSDETVTKSGTATINYTDMSGNIVGSGPATNDFPINGPSDFNEFGTPDAATDNQAATSGPDDYGWLGAHRRDQNAPAGITLMGERLYNPTLGRFLTVDPIPGGSANDYDYAGQDPIDKSDLNGQSLTENDGQAGGPDEFEIEVIGEEEAAGSEATAGRGGGGATNYLKPGPYAGTGVPSEGTPRATSAQ